MSFADSTLDSVVVLALTTLVHSMRTLTSTASMLVLLVITDSVHVCSARDESSRWRSIASFNSSRLLDRQELLIIY